MQTSQSGDEARLIVNGAELLVLGCAIVSLIGFYKLRHFIKYELDSVFKEPETTETVVILYV